jgi:DNA-binding NarL/FixJ family response regulator
MEIPASRGVPGRSRMKTGGVKLRCLIVDDSPRYLEVARGLLERQGVTVVGLAMTANQAEALATQLRPDVALVDIGLGEESGFDVAGRLANTRVILISTRDADDFAELVGASPAVGFLPKSELSRAAIRRLLDDPPVSGPRET